MHGSSVSKGEVNIGIIEGIKLAFECDTNVIILIHEAYLQAFN
jgi:hypothetical protein